MHWAGSTLLRKWRRLIQPREYYRGGELEIKSTIPGYDHVMGPSEINYNMLDGVPVAWHSHLISAGRGHDHAGAEMAYVTPGSVEEIRPRESHHVISVP
eukprot:3388418-Rhodomonas_salina.5